MQSIILLTILLLSWKRTEFYFLPKQKVICQQDAFSVELNTILNPISEKKCLIETFQ